MERVYEEVAYVAYHFHWDYATILGLDHRERRNWAAEISRINRRLNEATG